MTPAMNRRPEAPSSLFDVLIVLRWVAVVAQAVTVAVVEQVFSATLPLGWLFFTIGVAALTNLAIRPISRRFPQEHVVGSVLVLDVVLLSVLLGLAGGPANPFSVLYLVHVTLAATVTRPRWTFAIAALASVGFGLLFFFHQPLPPSLGGHGEHHMHGGSTASYSAHLQGMWLAFTVTAVAIAALVSRLSSALRIERENNEKATHLLGLATLAAGAAHELGTPLATIRVAASELESELRAQGLNDEVLSDLRLVNDEVLRARRVLDRMAIGAGELVGEAPQSRLLREVLDEALTDLAPEERARISCRVEPPGPVQVRWPSHAVGQVMVQLMRNALDASTKDGEVSCRCLAEGAGVSIQVTDAGVGMSPEVLARLGEPFFSTRGERGMGLGVFIAQSLVRHIGGDIRFESELGKGTTVSMILPREVAS